MTPCQAFDRSLDQSQWLVLPSIHLLRSSKLEPSPITCNLQPYRYFNFAAFATAFSSSPFFVPRFHPPSFTSDYASFF